MLPEPLIESLRAALPADCTDVLAFALFVRLRHPRVRDYRAQLLAQSPETRVRVQRAWSVLAELLPCELVAAMREEVSLG